MDNEQSYVPEPEAEDESPERQCEQTIYRTKIHSIRLDYEVKIGNGKPTRHTAELTGDIKVLVTDLMLAPQIRKAINKKLKVKCEAPPGQIRKATQGQTGEEGFEPPECCYFVDGKWVCW